MRMNNALTTLVGEELEGRNKWGGTMTAPNGSLYGIPHSSTSRVGKFNPIDKSMTHIGPYLGDDSDTMWYQGAMTENGVIYCPPGYDDRGILKIDTNTDTVTELDADLLPERGDWLWRSCALALDGCIYFMPSNADRILKLDPNNGDAITSVGDFMGEDEEGVKSSKYSGTVVGIDGCVYGIPEQTNRILKYDPSNNITSFVGEELDRDFNICNKGALARDGCIYALAGNHEGVVLKIDTTNNSYCYVGTSILSHFDDPGDVDMDRWRNPILGIDGCIYWPSEKNLRTLKYDPHSDQTSVVGGVGRNEGYEYDIKWNSGALAPDGVIYCIPLSANQVLAIDPWGEFLETTKAHMEDHPEKFGLLFQTIEADVSVPRVSLSNFDHAVVKFGQNEVFEAMEKSMKPINAFCKKYNLFPFLIAASCKESNLDAIHHLLRHNPSWVNSVIGSLEISAPKNKKRRVK